MKPKTLHVHPMSKVRSSGTEIERVLGRALWSAGIRYRKQYRSVPGRPDFAVPSARIAIFCDSSFWHGRGWPAAASEFRSNREFWLPKIEGNIQRDIDVNSMLGQLGWVVLRFWDDEILKQTDTCVATVVRTVAERQCHNRSHDKNYSD